MGWVGGNGAWPDYAAIAFVRAKKLDERNKAYHSAMLSLGMDGRASGFAMLKTWEDRTAHIDFIVANAERYEWCQAIVNEVESEAAARVTSKLLGQIWITQDGREYYPQDMADSHLNHTIAMIIDKRLKRAMCSNLTQPQWLQIFRDERDRRSKA